METTLALLTAHQKTAFCGKNISPFSFNYANKSGSELFWKENLEGQRGTIVLGGNVIRKIPGMLSLVHMFGGIEW